MSYLDNLGLARFYAGLKTKCIQTINGIGPDSNGNVQLTGSGGSSFSLLDCYPVGSYYFSENSTSPAQLFGGSWARVTGRFLLGATDNGSTGSTLLKTAAAQAGSTGGAASHTLTLAESPSHHHTVAKKWLVATSDSGSSDQAVIRKAYVSSAAAGTLNTDSKGSDGDHNNMPPFRAVYIWYRIA